MCGCIASESWTLWNLIHFQTLFPNSQSTLLPRVHWSALSSGHFFPISSSFLSKEETSENRQH